MQMQKLIIVVATLCADRNHLRKQNDQGKLRKKMPRGNGVALDTGEN